MAKYTTTGQKIVFENDRVRVFDNHVIDPNGNAGTYLKLAYKESTKGVVVIPRFADGRFLLIRVHRYAFDEPSLEFPRGGCHSGEDFVSAAERELKEETSLSAESFELIGVHRPDTSILEVEAGVVLASVRRTSELKSEVGEAIDSVELLDLDTLYAEVRSGGIKDGFTLGALAIFAARCRYPDPPRL